MTRATAAASKRTVWERVRKLVSGVATISLASGMIVASGATAAHALDEAVLTITKQVNVRGTVYDLPETPEVSVGEEFFWNINVICQQQTDQCVNTTMTDVIPEELEILEGSINSMPGSIITVEGQKVTIEFQEKLSVPPGTVGLSAGSQVQIPVKLRPIAQELDGKTLTNTATSVADNALEVSDSAAVIANVALTLQAEASKSFDPSSTLASPGAPVALTFGGKNASNGAVDKLVVQDPVNPESDPNIFQQHLQIAGLTSATWPEGAETAVVSVWDTATSAWVSADPVSAPGTLALPTSVDLNDAGGIRIEFTASSSSIPSNAMTSVQLALSQRASTGSIATDTTLSNTSIAQVSDEGEDSPIATQDATVTLRPASTSVQAKKEITPHEIAVTGATTQATVTLGATNTGTRILETLSISEPTNPADLTAGNLLSPAFTGGGVAFAGFGAIEWPNGATSAAITYHFADGSTEEQSTTTQDTLPLPESELRVTGFRVTFTGEIVEGAEAKVPFTVQAPADLDGQRIANGVNVIGVEGTTLGALPNPEPASANDDLTIYAEQINITTEKSLTNDWLWSIPGQTTTARLKTTIAPYPETTEEVTEVIIDDPSVTDGVTEWYEHFNATAITLTQIPANATLTVQWRDAADAFTDIPGMEEIAGGNVFSAPITGVNLDQITGIRFIFKSADGFVAGQQLIPNITYTTRETFRTSGDPIPSTHADPEDTSPMFTDIENCSASEAKSHDLSSGRVAVDPPCPSIDLMPAGPGTGSGITKSWSPDLVFTRSGQNTTVGLNWDAGVQGLDKVILSDVQTDAATGAPAELGSASVFDSFNLTRIGAINDPLFAFDQVQVQVYNGVTSEWEDLSSCTATSPCSGASIPAIDLAAAQQASTVAVRFIVTEKPGRVPAQVTDPLPGTGVAVGSRTIPLTLQIRDTLRSDASIPVVDGPTYNTPRSDAHSVIMNSSAIESYIDDVRQYRDTSNDMIEIIDPAPAVSAAKSVEGSPLAIPTDWTSQAAPSVRYTVSSTNQTAGVDGIGGRVDELIIEEPGNVDPAFERSPFEEFDLVRFQSILAPAGTTAIKVEFDGSGAPATITTNPLSPVTPEAQALAALQATSIAQLRNATGFTVTYSGNIASGDPSGSNQNGRGTVQFDLQLRQFERSNPTVSVTVVNNSPVENTVRGTISDKRWDATTGDFVEYQLGQDAAANVMLQGGSLGVTSDKSFDPALQVEPSNDPITMTLTGRPSGSERAQSLVLTDDRATFWNAYDYLNVANSFTLPNFLPNADALNVKFSVCTGRDFATWAADLDDPSSPSLPTDGCEATGGSWSQYSELMSDTAARAWSPTSLSPSVDPANVQGIRLQVERVTEAQWENPVTPTVNAPLMIERRTELRSGGIVPSTLADGNSPAPGESVKGVATNTVHAKVTGIWGSTAESVTDKTIEYRHARNAVEVSKSPIGMRSPGVPFDYTLTVKNTGARDIVDPVIVDRLPYDPTLGTLLQFDPDADDAVARYSFTASGPSSTDHPMPLVQGGPSGVTVAENLEGTTPTIAFTFPAGTILSQGESYTIVFKMMFVAGVLEGQPVVNGFDISSDRVWDACTAPSGGTATLNNGDTECYTTAQVTPQRLPAIRGIKSVRAVAPAGGYNDHGFVGAENCADRLDADSFAYQPCLPRTKPGQTEEWKLTLTNYGTTPLDRVVVTDLLPTPGDSTLIAGFKRHSQWKPTLTDAVPTMSGIPGKLSTYVTTAPRTEPCLTEAVSTPTDAGLAKCIDESGGDAAAASKFVPFESLSEETYASVTALLFVVEPVEGQKVAPGAVINLQFETETGAFSVQDAADPGAFNSLTVSALYAQSSAPDSPLLTMHARDQSRAGVALITGAVRIEKTVSGLGKDFVPADQVFAGTLKCTSLGQPIPDREFTVQVGTPTVIDNLPTGAECTALETAASGQTSYTATSVVVPEGADEATLPSIELDNSYGLTELVVRKSVGSSADVIPSGFEFAVACTFLGRPIDLRAADANFTLNDGGSHTITGLPVNASCSITETNDRNADSVNVEAESVDVNDAPWGVVTENNPGSNATIDGLAPSTGVNEAHFTNTYGDSAALRVEKALAGGAADLARDLTFEAQVVCMFGGEELLNERIELNAGNGWGTTLSSLVAGASCEITESDLQGADAVVITPNDGVATDTGVVEIPADATAPVLVSVTNRYLAASLEVTKSITGDGAALYGTGDFTVQLACTLNGAPVRVIGGATRTLNAGNLVAEYTGIPNGAECALTETENAGATESSIRLGESGPWVNAVTPGVTFTVDVDATVTSNDDQPLAGAQLQNRFDLAEVAITKHVVSEAVDQDGKPLTYGPFDVALACTFNGESVSIPGGAERTIADGEVVVWEQLPAGADCSVEETASADAAEIWFEQAPADENGDTVRTDGQVLEFASLAPVGDASENTAQLFNAFAATNLSIVKSLTGQGAERGKDKQFEVDLVCVLTDATRPDGEEVWNANYRLSAANDWRVEVAGLASGAECKLTETERGDAGYTEIRVGGVVTGGHVATFVADEAAIAITVVNTFYALALTGGTATTFVAIVAALLLALGAGAVAASRRKRGANARE